MSTQTKSICVADVVLRTLRGRWATHILSVIASHESIHFNELKRVIPGISAKVLTEQLRFLETAGVIKRHATGNSRQEVGYTYTARGHELKHVLDSFNELATRWAQL